MKKFSAILTIVALAAIVALAGFVTVSANSNANSSNVTTQIQDDDFYTEGSYAGMNTNGVQAAPDTLTFLGVGDRTTQVRVADLFSQDASMTKVHYTAEGQTLVIDKADLPAGVTSYTVTVAPKGNHVTLTEVKNGQTKTRVGYAISKYSAAMINAQQAN